MVFGLVDRIGGKVMKNTIIAIIVCLVAITQASSLTGFFGTEVQLDNTYNFCAGISLPVDNQGNDTRSLLGLRALLVQGRLTTLVLFGGVDFEPPRDEVEFGQNLEANLFGQAGWNSFRPLTILDIGLSGEIFSNVSSRLSMGHGANLQWLSVYQKMDQGDDLLTYHLVGLGSDAIFVGRVGQFRLGLRDEWEISQTPKLTIGPTIRTGRMFGLARLEAYGGFPVVGQQPIVRFSLNLRV